jgi:ubiquinol-cytochrome c reductase cytochrome b subunit
VSATSTARGGRAVAGTANFLDERLGLSRAVRTTARKVFPDHWSFELGQVTLYSFVVLLISGTFLTLFYVPSAGVTSYEGAYGPLNGVQMSEAYASTLALSFDVRGGLLMRQVHHWAALLFVAGMTVHMYRVYFTGSFRKPRELNWVIGAVLMLLALGAGFTGYSLPDDLLSGNGLRIIDGVIKSIPLVGTYLSFFVFGGEFPGEAIIPRLYIAHVLIVPGLLLLLIGLHVGLVVLHKHTQFPGPGHTERNVVGFALLPTYAAKAGGFFFMVFGVLVVIGGTVSINPVWNYGPYDPSPVSAGTQPDWYILFIDGGLRLMPGLEPQFLGYTLSLNVLVPALVLPLVFVLALVAYPFIEAWVTGDRREHHLADRPRNAPTRTGLGVMSIVAYLVLTLAAANDIIATHFGLSINDLTQLFRVGLFLFPPIAFVITRRICLSLQRKDRDLALHGRETGTIVRTPEGEFYEVHEPLAPHERWTLVQHDTYRPLELDGDRGPDGNGVEAQHGRAERLRARMSRFFFEERVEPAQPEDLHHDHAPAGLDGGAHRDSRAVDVHTVTDREGTSASARR